MWLAPAAIASAMIAAYFVSPSYRSFLTHGYQVLSSADETQVQQWARGFGHWGVLLIFGAMLAQVIVLVVPSTFMEVASVLVYGPFWGGLLAWTSAVVAAAFGYGIGWLFGFRAVDRILGGKTRHKIDRYIERYGFWTVMLARFSPIFSIDAVSVVAGAGRMSFGRFLAATGLGMAPFAVLLAVLGSDFERLETGLIVFSIANLVALATYVAWDHRRARRDYGT